jgi:uncharacterized protein YndB with AHSA1/START domain
MPDIAMQIDVAASAEAAYRALTTTDGVAGWWTDRNETSGVTGQVNRFHFPDAPVSWDMRVEQAQPAKLLAWHCVGGPPQWVGTDVRWTLQPAPDGADGADGADGIVILFDHTGFAEVDAMFRIVTLGWAEMLLRLRDYLQTGVPAPYFRH